MARAYAPPVTSFESVKVAAVQATPAILDAEASIQKAAGLLRECAGQGVKLAVLPEAFVSVFPSNSWARGASDFSGWDELWERLWASSVDVPGPLVYGLVDVCREADIHCAIGVNERESGGPGPSTTRCCCSVPRGCFTSTAS